MYQSWFSNNVWAGMAIASHRTLFSQKNRIYISYRHPQKNRISKLNKNNLRKICFFYKLYTVLYLVASLTVSS